MESELLILVLEVFQNEIVYGRSISDDSYSFYVREALQKYGAVSSFQLVYVNRKVTDMLNMFKHYPVEDMKKYINTNLQSHKNEVQILIQ